MGYYTRSEKLAFNYVVCTIEGTLRDFKNPEWYYQGLNAVKPQFPGDSEVDLKGVFNPNFVENRELMDAPDHAVVDALRLLASQDFRILFLSKRETHEGLDDTICWLKKYFGDNYELFMCESEDYEPRPGCEVLPGLLARAQESLNFTDSDIYLAIDRDPEVIKLYQSRRVRTIQVKEKK